LLKSHIEQLQVSFPQTRWAFTGRRILPRITFILYKHFGQRQVFVGIKPNDVASVEAESLTSVAAFISKMSMVFYFWFFLYVILKMCYNPI
jgi:hypothetical protein